MVVGRNGGSLLPQVEHLMYTMAFSKYSDGTDYRIKQVKCGGGGMKMGVERALLLY